MGFMDKVKETAQKAAEGAKKGSAQLKDKVEDTQLRRKADENAKQIGYLVVQQKTEGASNGAEIDRLADEIVALEAKIAEGPSIPSAPAAPGQPAPPPPPTSASEPAAGDFKLD
jgi:ATP-dependent DNA ligase